MSGLFSRLYRGETTFNFIGRRWIGFGLSLAFVVITIVSLFARGLNLGINPYADPTNSMEYPVGTGYIASFLARFSDDFIQFFDITFTAYNFTGCCIANFPCSVFC